MQVLLHSQADLQGSEDGGKHRDFPGDLQPVVPIFINLTELFGQVQAQDTNL